MKVIRLHAPGDLRIHQEPLPHCGLDEVLVRVRAVGVCALFSNVRSCCSRQGTGRRPFDV
jgi:NADPH:quinone reductase-like Zn-dependent oxidoreductase